MVQLVTKKREEAIELDRQLSDTHFQNAETFIAIYQEGWLNRQDERTKEIAQRVSEIYQNVQLKKGLELIFVSHSEVIVEELIDALKPWKYLTKLKRSLDAHFPGEESANKTIFFSPDIKGFVLSGKNKDGYIEFEKIITEQFFRGENEAEYLFENYSSLQDKGVQEGVFVDATYRGKNETKEILAYPFKVSDLTSLDDSFITKIYDEIKF